MTAHRWRPLAQVLSRLRADDTVGCESWSPRSQSSAFSTLPKLLEKTRQGMGANLSSPGFLLRLQGSVPIQLVAYIHSLPLSTEGFPDSSENELLNPCMHRAAGPRCLLKPHCQFRGHLRTVMGLLGPFFVVVSCKCPGYCSILYCQLKAPIFEAACLYISLFLKHP